ncbi:MAG: transcriptional repressor, partial [Eubacteriales bacterium]
MNFSKQRESILNYLRNTKEHPTAERIYADLKPSLPNLSLATVYR